MDEPGGKPHPALTQMLEAIVDIMVREHAERSRTEAGDAAVNWDEQSLSLWGANHELDPDSRSLLGAAIEQTGLMAEAVRGFEEQRPQASGMVSQHADTATVSMTGMPAQRVAAMMAAAQRRDAKALMALAGEEVATARRASLFARSFVYELAVFRKLLEQLANCQPAVAAGCAPLIGKLDALAPGVIALRDSLAHYDERAVAKARGKKMITTPHTVGGETLERGLRLNGTVYGGHAASGEFVEVEICAELVAACRRLIRDAYGLFPAKPGLQQAMENLRKGVSGN